MGFSPVEVEQSNDLQCDAFLQAFLTIFDDSHHVHFTEAALWKLCHYKGQPPPTPLISDGFWPISNGMKQPNYTIVELPASDGSLNGRGLSDLNGSLHLLQLLAPR